MTLACNGAPWWQVKDSNLGSFRDEFTDHELPRLR